VTPGTRVTRARCHTQLGVLNLGKNEYPSTLARTGCPNAALKKAPIEETTHEERAHRRGTRPKNILPVQPDRKSGSCGGGPLPENKQPPGDGGGKTKYKKLPESKGITSRHISVVNPIYRKRQGSSSAN